MNTINHDYKLLLKFTYRKITTDKKSNGPHNSGYGDFDRFMKISHHAFGQFLRAFS